MINDCFKYIGVFFEADYFWKEISRISDTHLFRVIENPHITFSYKPEMVDEKLFGEKVEVKIVAYGNDGSNEGVKVEFVSGNEVIKTAFSKIEMPHITISVSESAESVNTRDLEFEAVRPIIIEGKYGGYDEINQKVVLKK